MICPRCSSRGILSVESIGDCTQTHYVCGHRITLGPPVAPPRKPGPNASLDGILLRRERDKRIYAALKGYAQRTGSDLKVLEKMKGERLSVACPVVGKAKRRG